MVGERACDEMFEMAEKIQSLLFKKKSNTEGESNTNMLLCVEAVYDVVWNEIGWNLRLQKFCSNESDTLASIAKKYNIRSYFLWRLTVLKYTHESFFVELFCVKRKF